MSEFHVRPWQAQPVDAQAVLLVDGETFDECPYDEAELTALAASGGLPMWLAWQGPEPLGYVSAFPTEGLAGPRWEIDLLAVRPAFRRQGVAEALLAAAMAARPAEAAARAWVTTRNHGSAAAFGKAGFAAGKTLLELWAYTIRGLQPRPPDPRWPAVRLAASSADRAAWARGFAGREAPALAARLAALAEGGAHIWLAEADERAAGLLALPVQTLHYRGLWLESIWSQGQGSTVAPLLAWAVELAKAQELDDVGVMLPAEARWRDTLPAEGYSYVDDYQEYRLE
ncbi:MAG: GNAT family N-acetyltransferase [Chloroflexi bacterium]|nr:GNAT family N-acetyltransferase [Chloroflexota bacterium]